MGKSPNLIEPFQSPNLDHEAEAKKHAAPAVATKITGIIIVISLIALFALVGIGLHIPTG